ncbi:unnamed protein product [Bursaphelenchus xylophilus]|uniref:(pine wood nematode) hypothetical protein n=1 Tax=Bursaphelenchus xylophilus TaxID=6326 RepID=A0A1I7SRL7_BURXY|nr:unnamed protein product [Bursaphelenchus xylophilus]CAG9102183.1 unnamed protein product [Bursaphelenchus xylophilus]
MVEKRNVLLENEFYLNKDKVKRDILVIWLLEVQLSELAELRRSASKQDQEGPTSPIGHKEQLAKKLREELFCFLNRTVVYECVLDNRAAVYRLISTHVDFDTYLFLANKLKDHEVVVKVHLLQGEFEAALEVAASQPTPQLLYKYAQDFFDNLPKLFLKTLIEQKENIRPNQVITAFFNCSQSPEKVATAFAYLNFVVNEGKADRTTLDFLIKLLAEYKPKQLLENLKKFGKSREFVKYDVERALRLCLEKKLDECAVFLYCLEGLYEDAVEKALSIDIKLAKECAKELDTDENPDLFLLGGEVDINFGTQKVSKETKKRVWLKIVKHMIQNGAEVGECTAILKESGNVLRIQDILPLFPEFTKIEHFKQPLCEFLKEHSKQISELQKEIHQRTECGAQLRSQTEKSSTNILVVKSGDKCAICSANLLLAPFFAFNCRHFFHQDCLIEYLEGIFTEKEKKLYSKMKEHEKSLKTEIALKSGKDRLETEQTLAKLRQKMTQFTCRECPFCSQQRIMQLLQTPLISEEEYEKISADWVL